MIENLRVSVSGVRGLIGASFTPQLACAFAQAFGSFVGRGLILVGRDTRLSGPMAERAVVAGLQSVGCKPVLAGIVPTPTMLFMVRHTGARGGIVITASHNPADWNALKFVDSQGLFLSAAQAEELFDLYHQQNFPLVTEQDIPNESTIADATEPHFRRLAEYVDSEAIRRRHFRVAVDVVNGVGALHTERFLREKLGCEVFPLFDEPSGVFQRDPEPLPANLSELRRAVVENKCDIGFAQDPDGDRLSLVDDKGVALNEDITLALAVEQVLDHHERGPVVINQSTSKCVEQLARARGCTVTRTRIGETNVTEAMLKENAVVGGEHNGGVIIPRIHPCRDSFAGMAIILERMVKTGKTISQLTDALPKYEVVRDKIPMRGDLAPEILRHLRREYADHKINMLDGLYVDLDDSWIHVRRSNTEPVLRITTEAATKEKAQTLATEVREKISRLAVG